MHSIVTSTGENRQSHFLRVMLTVAYLLFTSAGVLLLLSPQLAQVYEESGQWMASFIVFGGILSAIGNALRRWVGEFIGAPVLAVGVAVLGCESWLTTHDAYPYVAGANLAVLLGIAVLMIVRWRRVLAVYNLAHSVAKMEKGVQGGERQRMA